MPQFNRAVIKDLLDEGMTEEEFTDFVFMSFETVWRSINTTGLTGIQKQTIFLDYLFKHKQEEILIEHIRKTNVTVYDKLAPHLQDSPQLEEQLPVNLKTAGDILRSDLVARDSLPATFAQKVDEHRRIIAEITAYKKVHELLHEIVDNIGFVLAAESHPVRIIELKLDFRRLKVFLGDLSDYISRLRIIYRHESEGVILRQVIASIAVQLKKRYIRLKNECPAPDKQGCFPIDESGSDDLLSLVNEVRGCALQYMNMFDQAVQRAADKISLLEIVKALASADGPEPLKSAAGGLAEWDNALRTCLVNHTLLQQIMVVLDPVDDGSEGFLVNLSANYHIIQEQLKPVLVVLEPQTEMEIEQAMNEMAAAGCIQTKTETDQAMDKMVMADCIQDGYIAFEKFQFVFRRLMTRFLYTDRELHDRLKRLEGIGEGLKYLL
jgi:hypothetical protein